MRAVLKSEDLYERLVDKVGDEPVSILDLDRVLYSHDAAPLPKMMELVFKMTPDVVVVPRHTLDVQRVMKLANELEIPVTPRGGASWGLGGCVPIMGGILMDLSRMNKVVIDEDNLVAEAQAGVTWQKVYDKSNSKGYTIGTVPSSAFAATVGGWANTGGVGIGSYKYGGAYEQIRALEVVLPNGRLINTASHYTLSNGGGYNLNGLFIGSEGTLGVITKVYIKLHPKPDVMRPISFGLPDMRTLAKAMKIVSRMDIKPMNIGYADRKHMDNIRKLNIEAPDAGAILNLMFDGNMKVVEDQVDQSMRLMFSLGAELLDDGIAKHEWSERAYEFRVKRLGPSFITSSSFIPPNRLEEAYKKTEELGKKMKVNLAYIGIMAGRNTVDFMPYFLTDERKSKFLLSAAFTKKMADIAMSLNGRPVGLGLWMASNLPKLAGEAAFTMRDIKTALDPNDIMNPGKLVEAGTKWGFPIPAWAMNFGMNAMAFLKRLLPHDKLPTRLPLKKPVPVKASKKTSKGIKAGAKRGQKVVRD